MKVIIAGGREINSYTIVCDAIAQSGFQISEVVSGECRGVDRLGEQWARRHGVPIKGFPADWKMFGKQAGAVRNSQMSNYANGLIAVWDGFSRGTNDMIEKATTRGLKLYIHLVSCAPSTPHWPRCEPRDK